ncbi:MAG TPA: TolC family protein [Planctomycetota bacterium]|nr:TolC family protein [Planctomycetota bacterium]
MRSLPRAPTLGLALLAGCLSAQGHREKADRSAASIIEEKQREVYGHAEPFTIDRPSETFRRKLLAAQGLPITGPESLGADKLETIEHWPEEGYPYDKLPPEETEAPWEGPGPYVMSLNDALMIGARNSREYQTQKEDIFLAALDLDVERNNFKTLFFSTLSGGGQADTSPGGPDGVEGSAEATATKLLKSGALLAGTIAIDLAKLLTGPKDFALGLFGDASITIPLLRGAGAFVVTEPLTQAERNTVYALRDFELFKQTFAVDVASGFLDVLRREDEVKNEAANYRNLIILSRQTRALADAGQLPGVQEDQARQDELRARDRWIASQQAYEARLDAFKQTLGIPTDARIALKRDELDALVERAGRFAEAQGPPPAELPPRDAPVDLPPVSTAGGPYELEEPRAIRLALDNRQDLVVARGDVYDAQRGITVAADALQAGLTLEAGVTSGARRGVDSASSPDANLDDLVYSASALLDLPLERTPERDAYRASYITLERSVRSFQGLEDRVKLEVRQSLRDLVEARESVLIQEQAVRLAQERVTSTNLVLEAGRGEVRDVLDAQESLLEAQNALTAAMIRYRVSELAIQRDMGVLAVGPDGLWQEYNP